ncbi:MAG: PAS domain-containing sensor histidine kinase [Proteobacteria bacterium]|nr:PAS domain-containing sensor histidine kinase [Pseudomonadota bacterium]
MNKELMSSIVMEMEKWQMIIVNDKLEIINVCEDKCAFFIPQCDLLSCFEDNSKKILMDVIYGLEGKEFDRAYLTTNNGSTLESLFVKDGRYLRCFFKDLTERISVWNKLLFLYQNFINNILPMFYTDIDGNILDANRSFLDFYGYSLEEVVGTNPRILKSFRQSPDVYKKIWNSILDKNIGNYSGEVINRRKDGREVTVFAFITTVFDFRGKIAGFVATHMNLSRLKYSETKAETREDELKNLYRQFYNMLSIISHDLKGPLNSIINYLELAKNRENYKDYLERSLQIAFSMSNFIKETITLAKVEQNLDILKISRCHIYYLLSDSIRCFEAMAIKKNVKIKFITFGEDEPIGCDVIKTEEIINNILENSIKHTPEGGTVSVEYINSDDVIFINFKDEGNVISKQDREKIFEPFYSDFKTKNSFGLGLYITQKYISLHKWKLEIKERDDRRGNVFSLIIYKDANRVPNALSAVIFDPSNSIINTLQERLKSFGINVYITKNLYELKRIYGLEKPDYIFVYGQYLDKEIEDFLKNLNDDKLKIVLISSEGKRYDFANIIIKEDEIQGLGLEKL